MVIQDPPADPDAAVRDGDVDLVLVIDEDYGEQFRSVEPAVVRIVHDSSRTASLSSIRRTRNLLRGYSSEVGLLRLLARGVSPGVMQAVRVDDLDLATPAQTAARFFSMLPMFLILGSFIGGLNVAIDTTAGERERQSLEPLLVNPVSRSALTAGKWLTTSVFSLASAWLTLAAFVFMMRFVPLEELEMQLSLGGQQLLLMAVACGPMALFASSLQMFVATFARSFKEAQTYVNLLIFVPMIPGMVAQVYPLQPAPWMMLVPAPVAPAPADRRHGRRAGDGAEPGPLDRRHHRARRRLLRPHGAHACARSGSSSAADSATRSTLRRRGAGRRGPPDPTGTASPTGPGRSSGDPDRLSAPSSASGARRAGRTSSPPPSPGSSGRCPRGPRSGTAPRRTPR